MEQSKTAQDRAAGIEKILTSIQQDILEQSTLASIAGKPNDFATGYTTAVYMAALRMVHTLPGVMTRVLEGEDPLLNLCGLLNLQIGLYGAGVQLVAKENPDPTVELLDEYFEKFTLRLAENYAIDSILAILKGRVRKEAPSGS